MLMQQQLYLMLIIIVIIIICLVIMEQIHKQIYHHKSICLLKIIMKEINYNQQSHKHNNNKIKHNPNKINLNSLNSPNNHLKYQISNLITCTKLMHLQNLVVVMVLCLIQQLHLRQHLTLIRCHLEEVVVEHL